MTGTLTTAGRSDVLRLLARHLQGAGVELGPGHHPFPLPHPGTSVRLVDRWDPAANRELFPELGGDAPFPQPDLVADLDRDRLSALVDGEVDFVVASHVLEHLAEPVGMLADIHRALRPGGVLLLLLPDRRRTFDRDRRPTPLAHLLVEHAAGVTAVADDHVEDFLRGTGEDVDGWGPDRRAELFALHRSRSIHVHCWSEDEWADVVRHCVRHLGQRWELVEVLNNADVPDSIEFGMVLRRSDTDLPAAVLADRFDSVLADLGPRSVDDDPLARLRSDLALARQDAANWRALAESRGRTLERLARSPLGPALRLASRVTTRRLPASRDEEQAG